jgi:hypothetical protein
MLCKGNCGRILTTGQHERGFCEPCYEAGKRHNEQFHKDLDIITCHKCFKDGARVEVMHDVRKYTCLVCNFTWQEPRVNESPSIVRIKVGA